MNVKNDTYFMKEAFKEAKKSLSVDEVPVGAVVVQNNKIIARGHNQVEMLKDTSAHAEMLTLTSAMDYVGNKWLLGCSMYVTLEPCSMCAGALVLSRIEKIVYGADDPKAGACGSVIDITNNKDLNHRIKVKGGVCKEECSSVLKEFFIKKRSKVISRN